jgi:E3 ubiquitin-protein ligase UBR3
LQVRAGLWARNGRSMHQLVAIYSIYEGGADLDLFLLQCLAVLLPREPFVQQLVDAFGLKDHLGLEEGPMLEGGGEGGACAANVAMVEELLLLVMHVVAERAGCGSY